MKYKFLHYLAVFLLPFFSVLATSAIGKKADKNKQPEIYADLKHISLDEARTVHLTDVALHRDRGTLRFEKGTLYLLKPVFGRVTGAVFLGDVHFHLKPPTAIERYQMDRFVKSDSLSESFGAVYLRFTDKTEGTFLKGLDFTPGPIPTEASDLLHELDEILLEDRGINLHSRIAADLLNGSDGLFFAAFPFHGKKLNFPSYYLFNIDQNADEEIAVFQYFPHRANKTFYTLCSFDEQQDDGGVENKDGFEVEHYQMTVSMQRNGHVKMSANISLLPHKQLKVISFDLFHELSVDSVRDAVGDSVAFVKEKEEEAFSVFLNEPLTPGRSTHVTVFYSGDLLQNSNSNYFLKDNLNWYPRSGYLRSATYEITYDYPKRLQVVSTGKRIKQWQADGRNHAIWVEPTPSLAAAFGLGFFDDSDLAYNDSLSVSVYSTKDRTRNVRKKIAGDVASSFYFFETLFGSYPYSKLHVVETPTRVSNGYPGTLFLTSLTFALELEGVMQELRGHEVSHQWWGNLVGWKSYHDQWLSEGFAEYSGALMNQFLIDGDKRFFQALQGWRNDLLDKGHIGVSIGLRRFGFSKADLAQSDGLEAGPIWLGNRLGSKYPVDYYVNVYEKGAYVMHMLRIMLRDFDSGSDARFWRMLTDYVQTFKGRKASTHDFKTVVDHHLGQDMKWFFDQWIYGTGVPKYVYSKFILSERAGYFVQLQVSQEDVPASFKAYIPVSVKLENERQSKVIIMTGKEKTFRLGPFESNPKRVTFNDWGGVLARIESK